MLIALAPAPLPTPQKYPVESSKVSFPNAKTCRELERLKKEVEALQEKCKECHSKNPGETNPRFLYWKGEWIHSSGDSRPLWNN